MPVAVCAIYEAPRANLTLEFVVSLKMYIIFHKWSKFSQRFPDVKPVWTGMWALRFPADLYSIPQISHFNFNSGFSSTEKSEQSFLYFFFYILQTSYLKTSIVVIWTSTDGLPRWRRICMLLLFAKTVFPHLSQSQVFRFLSKREIVSFSSIICKSWQTVHVLQVMFQSKRIF